MSDDAKNARAEAAAEKARAKAMRPWYRKKRWWLGGGLALIVLIAIIASAGGGGNNGTDLAGDAAGQDQETAETVGLNQPARDGKFEFTVTNVDCSRTEVGNEFAGTQAQGKFCFVHLTVRNIADEPQTLFSDNQKLFDAAGREYSADDEAWIYLPEAQQTLYEEINPGNQVEGIMIFDVPQDVQPVRIELHDSAFSGGVVVQLG
jgi:hypothetical protein